MAFGRVSQRIGILRIVRGVSANTSGLFVLHPFYSLAVFSCLISVVNSHVQLLKRQVLAVAGLCLYQSLL